MRRQSVALLDDNALGAATEDEEWLDHVASAEIDSTARTDGRLDDERVTDRNQVAGSLAAAGRSAPSGVLTATEAIRERKKHLSVPEPDEAERQ